MSDHEENTWPAALVTVLTDHEVFRRLMWCLSLLSGVLVVTFGMATAVLLVRGDVAAALLGGLTK
ncbi:hypothetical protein [Amycolatopsis samaneae]|uniref:Uncharacterized protein n=1 Tax=Amycolatopsis samaneae TaxID=664691 RepID=A0ABW5GX30_9PSEU